MSVINRGQTTILGKQIRTFWYALLWAVIVALLFITVFGIPFAWILAVIAGLWVVYRITRGWAALINSEPMPVPM